ncbi:MAG TPA: hypothetical protein VFV52_09360 [Bacilli bacterium]|nr:hypothetical protein [Bacilli bacterium]
MSVEVREKIERALQLSGLASDSVADSATFLGEGAWHEAYLLTMSDRRRLVMRFPKKVAYGQPVEYDEAAMKAEYAGTGYYYKLANQVEPGICPEEYDYHVSPELTYTLETYVGETIDMAIIDLETAYSIGYQRGTFMRKMDGVEPGVTGYAFLNWDEERGELRGQVDGDFRDNLREEQDDYRQDLDALLQSELAFDRAEVERKWQDVFARRAIDTETLALTNRDTSPENTVLVDGRLRVIDPLPILYSGKVMAGNVLNNYDALHPLYHTSPRYAKHRWNLYEDKLTRIADGFLDGYSQGDADLRRALRGEEFLMLLSMVAGHYALLQQEELSTSQIQRSGDRQAIEERLPKLLDRLEKFSFA